MSRSISVVGVGVLYWFRRGDLASRQYSAQIAPAQRAASGKGKHDMAEAHAFLIGARSHGLSMGGTSYTMER